MHVLNSVGELILSSVERVGKGGNGRKEAVDQGKVNVFPTVFTFATDCLMFQKSYKIVIGQLQLDDTFYHQELPSKEFRINVYFYIFCQK